MSNSTNNSTTVESSSTYLPPVDPLNYSSSTSEEGICYNYWIINGVFVVTDPLLIPLCLWALYIGVSKYRKFRQVTSIYFYSIVFLAYGCMMTSAMFADDLSQSPILPKWFVLVVALVDVGLTSTIGSLFAYGGLASIGWINPAEKKWRNVMKATTALIFIIWTIDIFLGGIGILDLIMYDGIVGTSGLIFIVTEIVYLKRNNKLDQLSLLLLCGVCGASGVWATLNGELWCQSFHMTSSTYWFFISDVTMILLSIYIWKTRNLSSYLANKNTISVV
ncbi:hypothetical protein DLAC_05175 [Tieghemostelium lacteum]|uniref:Transmembrane protein n=1 Tax=Tieghemostelium lacteum TaxID=361077 RepID=A0A151ZIG7_TIELA|nr:hypothetical protein DLAC_05175 [Tieghemostelium lacteum]|eukprot:KYQ93782.1 hypothetical protein DLAC_05175 [Tieghemostelium lacteum]